MSTNPTNFDYKTENLGDTELRRWIIGEITEELKADKHFLYVVKTGAKLGIPTHVEAYREINAILEEYFGGVEREASELVDREQISYDKALDRVIAEHEKRRDELIRKKYSTKPSNQ